MLQQVSTFPWADAHQAQSLGYSSTTACFCHFHHTHRGTQRPLKGRENHFLHPPRDRSCIDRWDQLGASHLSRAGVAGLVPPFPELAGAQNISADR